MTANVEGEFETQVVGDVRIIRMPANMPADFSAREPYRQALARLIEASPERKLLINLRDAPFYDSMSMGVLVAAHSHLRKHGYECRFCGVSRQTRWGLEATQLTKVLAVFDDEPAALNNY